MQFFSNVQVNPPQLVALAVALVLAVGVACGSAAPPALEPTVSPAETTAAPTVSETSQPTPTPQMAVPPAGVEVNPGKVTLMTNDLGTERFDGTYASMGQDYARHSTVSASPGTLRMGGW